MEQLTYTTLGEWKGYLLRQAPERVLQFGEEFPRGFADHFIYVMNERAGFNGKAVVVASGLYRQGRAHQRAGGLTNSACGGRS